MRRIEGAGRPRSALEADLDRVLPIARIAFGAEMAAMGGIR